MSTHAVPGSAPSTRSCEEGVAHGEDPEAQGSGWLSQDHTVTKKPAKARIGSGWSQGPRPDHSTLRCRQSFPKTLKLGTNSPVGRPDSQHPSSRWPDPLIAPRPVGSTPRVCGLSPGPSGSHGLVVCPCPTPHQPRPKRQPTGAQNGGGPGPRPLWRGWGGWSCGSFTGLKIHRGSE